MKKIIGIFAVLSLLVSSAVHGGSVVNLFNLDSAFAVLSDGADAIDALGQLDGVGAANYTKSGPGNTPNNESFDYTGGTLFSAVDSVNHRLFVSNTSSRRILVFNLDGSNNLIDRYADNVLGQSNLYSGSSGLTQSTMDSPMGLAYDSAGNRLFVSDANNNRVLVYDVAAITDGENAANVLGQPNFTTGSSALTQSKLNYPQGLTYDSANSLLFVADSFNRRVMIFDVTAITDGENAVNVFGQPNFTSNAQVVTQAGMDTPAGVCFDSVGLRVFVSDYPNNRVLVYDTNVIVDGEVAINVLGQADFVTSTSDITQAKLDSPYGCAYDSATSHLFVGDYDNRRVMVYDVTAITDGENAVNVLGQSVFTSYSSAVTSSVIGTTFGLSFDSSTNRLYAGDSGNGRVMIFDVVAIADGEVSVDILGHINSLGAALPTVSTVINTSGFDGVSSNGTFSAVDTVNHRLFVSDISNNRILVFNMDASNDLLDRYADNVLGQLSFYSNSSATTQGRLSSPEGLVFDSVNNRLFVSDGGNNRIMVFDTTAIIDGENAVGVLGQSDYVSSGSARTQDKLNTPISLAYDEAGGRLFVEDYNNLRVMIFNVTVVENGESAINVVGQADFTSAVIGTTASTIGGAGSSIAYDSTNNRLFVSDNNNYRVLVFDVASIANGEAAVNVLGQANFTSGASLGCTQSTFCWPSNLVHEGVSNRLFVSEPTGNRVLVFSVASITDGEDAVNVLGQTNFTASSSATTRSKFNSPKALSYDSVNERLYVSDVSNHRIVVFDAVAPNAEPAVDTAPALSVQSASGNGYVTITTTISDADSDNTKLKVEYSDDNGVTWYDPDLVSATPSAGMVDLADANPYQIGTVDAIDTSGGAITLSFVWDTLSALNGNGTLDGTDQSDIKIRVTANDGTVDGTATASAAFEVDNLDPASLASFVATAATTSMGLTWTAATETTFANYDIWYGTVQADVQGRTGTATEWDESDDVDLATVTTADTSITGLSVNTQYYFKIWAVDDYGNEMTVADIAKYTLAAVPVTGSISPASCTVTCSVSLSWAANGNPGTTLYYVTRSGSSLTSTVSTSTSDSLGAAGTYSYEVYAKNGDNVSTVSLSLGSVTANSAGGGLIIGGGGGGGGGGNNDTNNDQNTDDQNADDQSTDDVGDDQSNDDQTVTDDVGDNQNADDQINDDQTVTDDVEDNQNADDQFNDDQTVTDDVGDDQNADDQNTNDQTTEQVSTEIGVQPQTLNGEVATVVSQEISDYIAQNRETVLQSAFSGGGVATMNYDNVDVRKNTNNNTFTDLAEDELFGDVAVKKVIEAPKSSNVNNRQIEPDVPNLISVNGEPNEVLNVIVGPFDMLETLDTSNIDELAYKLQNFGEVRTDDTGVGFVTVNVTTPGKYFMLTYGNGKIGKLSFFEVKKAEKKIKISDLKIEGTKISTLAFEEAAQDVKPVELENMLAMNNLKIDGKLFVSPKWVDEMYQKNATYFSSLIKGTKYESEFEDTYLALKTEYVEKGKQVLSGYADPGKKVVVAFRSATFASVVIADKQTGYFEAEVPKNIPAGDHIAYVYSVDENNQAMSSVLRMIFKMYEKTI